MLFQRTFKKKYKIHILEREQKPYFWFLERNRWVSGAPNPSLVKILDFVQATEK
jgi:hypothetical protein